MQNQAKNLVIGIFVIAALCITVFAILFLRPSVGDGRTQLHVRFADIDKVTDGTRVIFAGKPVGEVAKIHELKSIEEERVAKNGYVYAYELTLRVDSRITVFNSDEVILRTSGLLGEKSVAIIPRTPKKGEELSIVTSDDVIYATESGSMEEVLQELKSVSSVAKQTLNHMNVLLIEAKREEVIPKLASIFTHLDHITGAIDKPEKLDMILTNLDSSMKNLDTAFATLAQVTDALNKVTSHSAEGKGTIGRLFMTDDLYVRSVSVMSKAETLMNDMNHYGLLFHLDKGWQRLRARRMNLLVKLKTPTEFHNFFCEEFDALTTGLARVTAVMQRINALYPCASLVQDREFAKVFAELIRRSQAVDEALRMYNTQLVEGEVEKQEVNPCCN